ncbi:MAG: hypothetical protein QXY45_01850 [Candidatus Aenigmatarchaeota archaeon]
MIEYLSRAWVSYKKNFWSFILAEIVSMLPSLMLFFIGLLFLLSSLKPWVDWETVLNITEEEVLKEYILGLFETTGFIYSFLKGLLIFGMFVILAILVRSYFQIGIYGMAYESLKKRTRLKTMFLFSRKMGFRWLLTVLILFGIFLLVIPIIFLIGILTFGLGFILFILFIPPILLVAPSMVVEDASPTSAIKNAFNVSKKNYLGIFVLFLVYLLIVVLLQIINNLVLMIPIIGVLVNFLVTFGNWFVLTPVFTISLVCFYLKNRKKEEVELI